MRCAATNQREPCLQATPRAFREREGGRKQGENFALTHIQDGGPLARDQWVCIINNEGPLKKRNFLGEARTVHLIKATSTKTRRVADPVLTSIKPGTSPESNDLDQELAVVPSVHP